MARIPDDIIVRIKTENDILEVATEMGVELLGRAGEWVEAHCPFHDDGATPNLKFNSETNSYCCYACGAGTRRGTKLEDYDDGEWLDAGSCVIGFYSNMKKVGFPQAARALAKRAGILIPTEDIPPNIQAIYNKKYSQQKRFEEALTQEIREYLHGRGLTDDTIAEWGLGYVPQDYVSEVHRNRVSFPLFDDYGKTCAMAYRRLNEEQKAKYINDSHKGNDAYKKSEYLYGWNKAKSAIRKAGYAIVTEGYFDVILPHQLGLKNVVGICGTALTDGQIKKLKTVTNRLVLWLDSDNAGMKNMKRIMPTLLAEGFEIDIIVGSEDEDPADVVVNSGHNRAQVYKYLKDKRYPAVFYFVKEAVNEYERERIYLQRNVLKSISEMTENVNSLETKIWVENYLKKNLY